jgi:hypothetical protein
VSADGQSATVDACRWSGDGLAGILDGTIGTPASSPGPQLGRLHLARVLEQGYQVVRVTPC